MPDIIPRGVQVGQLIEHPAADSILDLAEEIAAVRPFEQIDACKIQRHDILYLLNELTHFSIGFDDFRMTAERKIAAEIAV